MLATESKDHTLYIPTQRCLHCKSANTSMQLVPGKKTHKNHEPVGINMWTCGNCHAQFKPSETPVTEPILICANCKDMTLHKFMKNEEIQHASLDGTQPKVDTINTHHHVISHMYSCIACGTVRVYGCHIGTA
jgi:transcription elongation factor Elf1